ncbi:hypothetical protein [Nocardioides sp. SR21]|uniref:hypothetical protein n=1 Tax=Nocardioides sp. SR21 TaxID=2919501 RepID=UPI001FA953EC|nr:hypothetical protein [Nocardioides sp. SR21]
MIKLAALLSAGAAVAALGVVPAAHATVIDGPSGDCAVTAKWSKPSSTTVKVTWTTRCDSAYYGIQNGVTLHPAKGSGQAETRTSFCHAKERQVKTCSTSVTISDPGGRQDYVSIDEVYLDDSYYELDWQSAGWSRSTFTG